MHSAASAPPQLQASASQESSSLDDVLAMFMTIPAVRAAMAAPDRFSVGSWSFWMDPTPVANVVHCPPVHYAASSNQSPRREGPGVGSREFWGESDPYRY